MRALNPLRYAVLARLAWADVREHDDRFQPDEILRVSTKMVNMACRERLSVVVNGTAPGPPIHLTPHKTTWIRVYNVMENDNLTMHWHGLARSVAPFSDGTPQLSQWPIPPLHFFDYELHAVAKESGTYFYHSHVGFQAVSANGALIIDDVQKPPYQYDDEKIMLITEYFNKTDEAIVAGLTSKPFVWSGETMAFLVNGNSPPARSIASPNDANLACGPELIRVDPGKTYRFRSIDGAALSEYVYGIEDHNGLKIIAADGGYTKPALADYFVMGSGQRFDFLLQSKSDAELEALGKRNFWIQIEVRDRPVNFTSYACLSYDGQGCGSVPAAPILDLPRDINTWMEYTLEPLTDNNFPRLNEVTRHVEIVVQQINNNGSITWHLNGRPVNDNYAHPSPYLVDIYEQGNGAIPKIESTNTASTNDSTESYDPVLGAYGLPVGEVVEIVWIQRRNMPAGGFDVHPLHAHGGHYYDIGAGSGSYDPVANEKHFDTYTPALRDTTILHRYTTSTTTGPDADEGWRAWRIRVEDAGVWFMHCHTLQHMVMGMQTVWVMGNASEIDAGEPRGNIQGYLNYGGDAYGSEGVSPIVNHWFESHQRTGRAW